MANVDLGHYVAAGGDPIQFLNKFHDRVASFHLKDRQTPAHGAGNLAWGKGDTPIREILQLVKKNKWTMPATIELEYQVPASSDAVKGSREVPAITAGRRSPDLNCQFPTSNFQEIWRLEVGGWNLASTYLKTDLISERLAGTPPG